MSPVDTNGSHAVKSPGT